MSSIRVDLTNVVTPSFEPLPSGTYTVRVDDYKEKTTGENAKNPGRPLLSWKLVVTEGQYEGRVIWDNMPIIEPNPNSEKGTLWRVKAFLDAAGFETEGELELDPEEILESVLRVKLSVTKERQNEETGETYQARNEVKGFLPVK